MNNKKIEILEKYIKANISPILLEDIPTQIFKNAVILGANCDISLLNGHYEEMDFVPPKWYIDILENSKNKYSLLVIDKINQISQREQLKFVELFKYKKISTFDLPKNCVIVVTCKNLQDIPIVEEIYSLLVHI